MSPEKALFPRRTMQQSLIHPFRLLIISLAFAGAGLAEETSKLPDLGPAGTLKINPL